MKNYFCGVATGMIIFYIGFDACWFVFKGLLIIFVVLVLLIGLLSYSSTLELPENEGRTDFLMPEENEATKTSR
jgi:hypothetical protein